MVARTRPDAELVVIFQRDGEEPEVLYARDPEHAWEHGILLIARRESLVAGDQLLVQHYDKADA